MEGIIQVSRLLIYDTSDFVEFPIGGQLTSIRNFLRYICEEHPARAESIVLVGVTRAAEEVGKWREISCFGCTISFLPVAAAQEDLGNTSKSLRLMYAKGLLRYGRLLKLRSRDCNYIHTPEAYGILRILNFRTPCVLFSHGSYFNMEKGFRFFQNNLLIKKGFVFYLKWMLRTADQILLLDRDSKRAYEDYNKHLFRVGNSVVCPVLPEGHRRLKDGQIREMLFAGRLSKDKRIEPIIQAVLLAEEQMHAQEGSTDRDAGTEESEDIQRDRQPGLCLTIAGSGEEYANLISYEGERIHFVGAVPPSEVQEYMQRADLLVMNSSFEGIPMTILEAISQGLPVVTTNVGGIGEVLRFGEDSEETDGTPEGILAAVRRIERHYEIYSRNAYENSKAYDYRQVNGRVLQLLGEYWREPGAPYGRGRKTNSRR